MSTAPAAAAPPVPSAADVRHALRRARRRSGAAKPLGETLSDLYVALFSVIMVVTIVAPTASRVLRDAGRRTASPNLALTLAGCALLAAVASALRALTTLGPVVRDPADATWLLASPVSRSALLAPGALLLFAVGGGAGLVVGAGCGLVSGRGVADVAAWAVLGGVLALAVLGVAVVAQPRPRTRRTLRRAADVVALASGVLLVLGLAGRASLPAGLAVPGTLAASVVAVPALALAAASLRRLRRSELVAGAGLALGLRATVTALDGSFVAETLRTRRLLERAVVAPRPLHGTGLPALVMADARRLARSPRPVLGALAMVPLGWAAADLYGRFGAAVALPLASWAAAGQLATGLRTVSRSASVARSLPFSDADLRAAHVVVPALGALLVASATTALTGRPPSTAIAAALVGTAAVLRTAAGRPPVGWEVQATTPLGSVPVGALVSYLVGLDVAVLTMVPLLLGARPSLSIGVPAAACALLVRYNRHPA